MACGCPLNASPWLNAEKSHRIKTLSENLGYGVPPMCSKHPPLCGTWATKAMSRSIFLFSYLYFFIFPSLCVCVCTTKHTQGVCVSVFSHIPFPPPFFFPMFHFFLFSSLARKKKKKQSMATELLLYCDYLLLVLEFFFFLLCAHTRDSYFW